MVMSACMSLLSVEGVVHLFLLGVGAKKVNKVCCFLGRGHLLESADSITQICENRSLYSHSNFGCRHLPGLATTWYESTSADEGLDIK